MLIRARARVTVLVGSVDVTHAFCGARLTIAWSSALSLTTQTEAKEGLRMCLLLHVSQCRVLANCQGECQDVDAVFAWKLGSWTHVLRLAQNKWPTSLS